MSYYYPPSQGYPPPGSQWYPQAPQQQGGQYPYPSQQAPPGTTGYPPLPGGQCPYPTQQPPPGTGYPGTQAPPGSTPQGWCGQYYAQIPQQELYELQHWFKSMDRDNSGSIKANELANVAIGGILLGIENGIKLIRVFDVDGSGSIEFNEYAALHKFLLSMQQTFKAADGDGSGRIDHNEISGALQKGGFTLPPNATQFLYSKFNKTGTGLNMSEFIGLVVHIALVRSIFERMDCDKDGSITLNLAQLYEMSANF